MTRSQAENQTIKAGHFSVQIPGQISAQINIACIASCSLGYFAYRTLGRREPRGRAEINRRDCAMVGAAGVVCDAFVNGYGKVRIGDTVWLAEGPDVLVNAPVKVLSVRGSRLIVGTA